ncbi:MAG: flagellin [Oscillospiraceae bacterium]|jgi:flagellin
MRINTNITAMNTYTQYTKNTNKIASSVARLSSGYEINSAADNAAGLAISEKMRAQIRGLEKAATNSQDAISLIQTAEGALGSTTEILQRMREIAVQSASDTNENEIDRAALQDEFYQLQKEIDEIAKTTTFNKKNLLDGSLSTNIAKLSNVKLANPGMSVELGKAPTGSYNFSVSVQQASSEIAAQKAEFTAVSSSDKFTVGTVTNHLSASSLANGNYEITVEYNENNKEMIFTAKKIGSDGIEFSAKLSEAELQATFGDNKAATLQFGNGDTVAFEFTVQDVNNKYTTDTSTMKALANELTDALTLSATGGQDAQAATYGLYAHLTGAESVKLEAGMSSVTFSNGVKVNFKELTSAAVSTKATATNKVTTTATGASTDTAAASATVNLSALLSDPSITEEGTIISLTIGEQNVLYTVKADATVDSILTDLAAAVTSANIALENTGAAGGNITLEATADTTNKTITLADKDGNKGASGAYAFSASVKADIVSYAYFDTFGKVSSTFDVINSSNAGLTFQVGANEGDEMVINIDKMDSNYLGVASATVTTQTAASAAISAVDKAINAVSSQRAYLGAIQNRLEYKISNLNTASENLTSAESLIRDVDMAKEMTNFTNANILQQAATAMLAQANALPQNVLSLIG